jgi:hypothetical protein
VTELSAAEWNAFAHKVSSFAGTLSEQEREFLGKVLALAEAAERQAEKERIEASMKEAQEKADNAMDAAQTGLWVGVVGGVVGGPSDDWPPRLKSSVSSAAKSVQATARDRKRSSADNIQKFLDIIRSMNTQR